MPTDEQHKQLRAPFQPEYVGKRPQLWCNKCSKSQGKVCDQHEKKKCPECDSYVSTAHMHLDFVGHARVTDRLLDVDPEWDWEPVATTPEGLPKFDEVGGLWIRLTIGDKTRLGYGHADGDIGGDATKEAIGDAIKNAAMRFGVALYLWFKDATPTAVARAGARQRQAEQSRSTQHEDPPRGQRDGHQGEPAPESEQGEPEDDRPGHVKARAHLGQTCKDNNWDLAVVGELFKQRHDGNPLNTCTGADVIARFRESLFKLSDAELRKPAAKEKAAKETAAVSS